jgi:hypothetical protein
MTQHLDDRLDPQQHTEGDGNVIIAGNVGGDVLHATAGNVYQENLQFLGDAAGVRDLIIRDEIDQTYVAWLRQRFVQPVEYADVLRLWASEPASPVVYLEGAPRTGRWTAAVNLLLDAAGTMSDRITVIEPDSETRLDLRRVRRGARVLLDLTDAEAATVAAVEKQLRAFIQTVDDASGRLVVLLSGHETEYLADNSRIRRFTAPNAREVLIKHLTTDGFADDVPAILDDSRVGQLLQTAEVRDAARLSALYLREVRSDRDAKRSIDSRVSAAVDAYHNWSDDLIKRYDEIDDTERRSLLLTVALLDNSTTETLYWSERLLLKLTKTASEQINLLGGKGFSGRLKKLEVVEFSHDRAWFRKHTYDLSVLRHVWTSYPELRDVLVNWVVELGKGHVKALAPAERDRMMVRFVDVCADNGAWEKVVAAATSWNAERSKDTTPHSVRLMTMAALDERIGRKIHKKMYDLVRSPSLDVPTADLVVQVCCGEFGRKHTGKALTLLGHIADRSDSKVAARVVSTVIDLAVRADVLVQVLTKTIEWLNATDKPRQWERARLILLGISDPDRGLLRPADLSDASPSELRVLLRSAWSAVLGSADDVAVDGAVVAWLRMAWEPEWRRPVLGILVEATDGDIKQLARLRLAARRSLPPGSHVWTRSDDDRDVRHEVHDQLTDMIDAVHPANADTPEETAHGTAGDQ